MTEQANQLEIHSSIISRLQTQHHSLQVILASIDSKRIELKPDQAKWNIHETIGHLVAYQQMFMERVAQALSEEVPFFCPYNADSDADFEYWRTDDIEHLMSQLNSDREKLSKVLLNLSDEQANRIAMHKRYGSHDIMQWAEFFLLHEAHHLYKIFQLAYDIEIK